MIPAASLDARKATSLAASAGTLIVDGGCGSRLAGVASVMCRSAGVGVPGCGLVAVVRSRLRGWCSQGLGARGPCPSRLLRLVVREAAGRARIGKGRHAGGWLVAVSGWAGCAGAGRRLVIRWWPGWVGREVVSRFTVPLPWPCPGPLSGSFLIGAADVRRFSSCPACVRQSGSHVPVRRRRTARPLPAQ